MYLSCFKISPLWIFGFILNYEKINYCCIAIDISIYKAQLTTDVSFKFHIRPHCEFQQWLPLFDELKSVSVFLPCIINWMSCGYNFTIKTTQWHFVDINCIVSPCVVSLFCMFPADAEKSELGEKCELDLQCQKYDYNSICHRDFKQCMCMDRYVNDTGRCVSVVGKYYKW